MATANENSEGIILRSGNSLPPNGNADANKDESEGAENDADAVIAVGADEGANEKSFAATLKELQRKRERRRN